MVAIADARPSSDGYQVVLPAGEEATGFAQLIGEHIEQSLAASVEKRAEATALRGRLGLVAREGEVAVTVAFNEEGVVIEDGLRAPDVVVSGDVTCLLHVLAGRVNPVWAMRQGRVAIRPGLRHPLLAYQAYHFLRLPGVHVWSGLPRPSSSLVAGAAAAAFLALVVWRVRARGRRGHA